MRGSEHMKTEQNGGFNYGFAQNLAQDSPKKAKNEIIQEIASFQLVPLFIVRFACLVVRL